MGVDEGGGVWLAVSVAGESIVTAGVIELGGGIINGVAVIMLGVDDGGTVQTGKGCGGVPNEPHALRLKRKRSESIFFMRVLYTLLTGREPIFSSEYKSATQKK